MLYAYCLAGDAPGDLKGIPGVGGAPLFVMAQGAVYAVVSRIDLARVEVTREGVLAHEQVVERVLEFTTPLPFRFGAVVSEADLARFIDSRATVIAQVLARVDGCIEMTAKVLPGADAAPERIPGATAGPGTRFLAARRAWLGADAALGDRARQIERWFLEKVGDLLRESVSEVRPGEAFVRLAHLVERSRIDAYSARVEAILKERPELKCLISGPWPPYTFGGSDFSSDARQPGR